MYIHLRCPKNDNLMIPAYNNLQRVFFVAPRYGPSLRFQSLHSEQRWASEKTCPNLLLPLEWSQAEKNRFGHCSYWQNQNATKNERQNKSMCKRTNQQKVHLRRPPLFFRTFFGRRCVLFSEGTGWGHGKWGNLFHRLFWRFDLDLEFWTCSMMMMMMMMMLLLLLMMMMMMMMMMTRTTTTLMQSLSS